MAAPALSTSCFRVPELKTEMTNAAANTNVIFLGIAERSSLVHDGESQFLKWNILGLKNIVFFNFFPANLSGFHLAFAFRHLTTMELKLRLLTEAHQELGFINIGATSHDFFPSVPPMTATREHILGFQPLR